MADDGTSKLNRQPCIGCKFYWEDVKACSITHEFLPPDRCDKFEKEEVDYFEEDFTGRF